MLFLRFLFFLPQSCKVHSRAYNECKLAQSRSREICEKSPTGCFPEVTGWWALQERELKSLAPQTDHGTTISHCWLTHSVFGECYLPLLSSWFIRKTIIFPNFSLTSALRKSLSPSAGLFSCHHPLSLSDARALVFFSRAASLLLIKLLWKYAGYYII